MKKCFILDTNVLLTDHLSPYKFEDNDVIIPMIVLEELDAIKQRGVDLSRDARAAIRIIDEIIGDSQNDVSVGVNIHDNSNALLRIIALESTNLGLDMTVNDNVIIAVSHAMGENAVMVSNDINMRLKAKGMGINAQRYKSTDVDDSDFIEPKIIEVEGDWLDSVPEEFIKWGEDGNPTLLVGCYDTPFTVSKESINTWLHCSETGWAAQIVEIYDDGSYKLKFHNLETMMKRNSCGIRPKNVQQAILMNDLFNPDIDVNIILGPAGSGKTLLAMAAGVDYVRGKRKRGMTDIIFTRSLDSQFGEIGFLPGSEHEKIAPWAGAAYDNLEVIAKASENFELHPKQSVEGEGNRKFIHMKAPNFLRGRSFQDKVLIVDECQNLTANQMKTILTRVGENCKIILMGNLSQIDNGYISANSSGLTYAAKKFASWKHASVIHMEGVLRSRTADFVESNF